MGGDAAEWWDEGAAPTPAKAVGAIKKHHIYTAGATAGSMATVWMKLEFADGTTTGRGSVEPSEPVLGGRQLPRGAPPACGDRKKEQDGQVRACRVF